MAIFQDDDLIDDRSFDLASLVASRQTDEFGHSAVAAQVGELAMRSPGRVNIAVFGPWGAGKSSLFALMRQALTAEMEAKRVELVAFDAWQNAGTDFSVNFLSAVAKSEKGKVRREMASRLFRTRKTLTLPFGLSERSLRWRVVAFAAAILMLVVVIPGLWTLHEVAWSWTWDQAHVDRLIANIRGWLTFSLSGTVLVVLAAIGTELTRVSVEESAPSHTTQFREIFDDLVGTKAKLIVFVDELDRCSPTQLMETLEGLRTFLGHERVVFVAAFDREAVAATVAKQREKSARDGQGGAAYYQTAGEYLDKIFQFQLSLPPQSAHTMRKFALALVSGRGGVWAALRTSGTLERVISLLAPAHIRSPRRAKVLLNDFAVNARGLELLVKEEWVARADELAVWTVLQTEFPQLAADMTREPDLPRYIIDPSSDPQRGAYRDLVKSYREAKGPLDATSRAEAKAVGERQHFDLVLYLERVQSMGVTLPQPDLVWRTKSRAFEAFEDQGLYRALVRAPDQTSSATLAALESASDSDVQQAIAFLGRLVEQEFAHEAQLVARTMGELANKHPDLALKAAEVLASTLRRVGDTDVSWNSPSSAQGFGQAMASVGTSDQIASFLAKVQSDVPESTEVIISVVGSLSEARWSTMSAALRTSIVKEVPESTIPLRLAVGHEDRTPTGFLTSQLRHEVAEGLKPVAPVPVTPERNTSQAIAAAAEANRLAEEEFGLVQARAGELLLELTEVWDELGGHGEARSWLLSLLRDLETSLPSAAREHDRLLTRIASDQSDEDTLILTLEAMIEQPLNGITRWTFNKSEAVGPTDLTQLFWVLLRIAIVEDPDSQAASAGQIRAAIAAFGDQSRFDEVILDDLPELELALGAERYRPYLDALDLLAVKYESRSARDHLIDSMTDLTLAPSANPADLLQIIAGLSATTKVELRRALHGELPTVPEASVSVVCRTLIAIELGLDVSQRSPIPVAFMRRVAAQSDWPDVLATWLTMGPRFDWLRRVADDTTLLGVDALTWSKYATNAGLRSSSDGWMELSRLGGSTAQLHAIASAGVEARVYDSLAKQLADGDSDGSRNLSANLFLGLPQGNRASAAAAAEAIDSLSRSLAGARSGDFRYVADLALNNHRKFTSAEKERVRLAVQRYRAPLGGNVTRLAQLKLFGLL